MSSTIFLLNSLNKIETIGNYISIDEAGVLNYFSSFLYPTIWRKNAEISYFLISIRRTQIAIEEREYLEFNSGVRSTYTDKPFHSYCRKQLISISNSISQTDYSIEDIIDTNHEFNFDDFIEDKKSQNNAIHLW